jgi:hypothetical protein
MIKGLAGMAVEMEGVTPKAFDLKELVQRQALLEQRQLNTEMIIQDTDWDHLERAATVEILHTLIQFVPVLSIYQQALLDFSTTSLQKNPIPTCRSKIFPLATNSCDEMHVQEMKQGVLDFITTQLSISKENLGNRLWVFSGDGKTFDQLLKLKKYLVAEEGDFESFRWLVPLLELWHTKWTDLSRIVRTHWGADSPDDPSTLARMASLAQCPTPSDLRKVDFYNGAHLVNLTLDAHLLNCWECINSISY